jgi:hypothetical protein
MDFAAEVRTKYPWLANNEPLVTGIVNKAKMFYYNLSYPADLSVDETTHPITGFRAEQWLLLACEEIVERLGFNSAIGYKENGIVWTFDNCHLSSFLIALLPPVVGVVK